MYCLIDDSKINQVGDPQQLPPTVETQHVEGDEAQGLEQTLFDRMAQLGYPTVVLKYVKYSVGDLLCCNY